MPQPLHVDTAELRISAARLDAVNGATSEQLTQNAGSLAGCQSGWAGTAFAVFEAVRDTWELADTARADRLGDIAMNLYRSADIYDHRDQASGEKLDGVWNTLPAKYDVAECVDDASCAINADWRENPPW